jgi:hypothetical protein
LMKGWIAFVGWRTVSSWVPCGWRGKNTRIVDGSIEGWSLRAWVHVQIEWALGRA